jgi:GT2 family glycosyltransferase
MTRYAVVVVLHNSEDDLSRLLVSLATADPVPTRIVVVDAGSEDHGHELARAAGCEVIDAGNVGFGAANNAGVELVKEPVTILLNPDIVVDTPGTLGALAALADSHDALHSPRLLNPDGSVQDSAHLRPGSAAAVTASLLPARMLPDRLVPWRGASSAHVGWTIAAAVAGRTGTLKRLGPFDPAQFLFYEDMDLCLRADRADVPTLLHPSLSLTHRGGHSTGPAYGTEPYELLAVRRREVVAQLGRGALLRDDLAQALGFLRSAVLRGLLRRGAERPLAQLRALRTARAGRPPR